MWDKRPPETMSNLARRKMRKDSLLFLIAMVCRVPEPLGRNASKAGNVFW